MTVESERSRTSSKATELAKTPIKIPSRAVLAVALLEERDKEV